MSQLRLIDFIREMSDVKIQNGQNIYAFADRGTKMINSFW